MSDNTKDKELLFKSKLHLYEALKLSKNFESRHIGIALHELAHIEFESGKIHEARQLWNESLKIAIETENKMLIINNINGLCDCDYEEDNKAQILKYRSEYNLDTELPANLERYAGHLAELEGKVLFEEGDYPKAIEKLGEAFVLLAISRSWGRDRLENELKEFSGYFQKTKKDEKLEVDEENFYTQLQNKCAEYSRQLKLNTVAATKLNNYFTHHLLMLSLKKIRN